MTNNDEIIEITQEGLEEKKKRLDFLISVERPRNIEAIKEARAQGDLSENADYDAARDEQARIEAEIIQLQNTIKNAKVIEISKSDSVSIGKRLEVKFKNGRVMKFKLVGTIEADPLAEPEPMISNMSPLGLAITGKKQGDTVRFKSEKGIEVEVKILKVEVEKA